MSDFPSLSDFITQTLIDLATGVANAREEVARLGGSVNPRRGNSFAGMKSKECIVSFDVSVFAEKVQGGNLGASTTIVGVLSFSAQGETEHNRNQNQNRIRFEVPIQLPTGEDTDVPSKPMDLRPPPLGVA